MVDAFDPYHRWLGIPPEEQPPHHYRLLGISTFETDCEVIRSVAARHIAFLEEITDASHVKAARKLRDELDEARQCLLDEQRKASYDADLERRLDPPIKPPPLMTPPPPPDDPPVVNPSVIEPPADPPVLKPPADRLDIAIESPSVPEVPDRRSTKQPTCLAVVEIDSPPTSYKSGRFGPSTPPAERKRIRAGLVVAGSCAALTTVIVIAVLWFGSDRVQKTGLASTDEHTGPAVLNDGDRPDPQELRPPKVAEPTREVDSTAAPKSMAAEGLDSVAEHERNPQPDPMDLESVTAAPREFTHADPVPAETRGLLLWVDAADEATVQRDSASRVIAWEDKSGSTLQATVTEGTSGPLWNRNSLAGNPILQFTGTESLSISGTSSSLNLGSQYTLIHVAQGDDGCLLSKGSGESPGSFAFAESVACMRIGGVDFSATGDDGQIARVRTVRATGDTLQWRIDGKLHQEHVAAEIPIDTTGILRIGCFWKRGAGAQQCFQGNLAELLIYDRALEDVELSKLETYLAEKWLTGDTASPPPPVVDVAQSRSTSDPTESAARDNPEMTPNDSAADLAEEPDVSEDPWLSRFVPLEAEHLEATGDTQFQRLDDGSFLADGATRENEQYRIVIASLPPTITAFRFEALPHDSLPGNGPGWGASGRFSLAEIQARFIPLDTSLAGETVRLYSVAAEDSELARRVIDRDEQTCWTVTRRGQPLVLTIYPSAPLTCPAQHQLVVTLSQRENLGCFRLSATSAPNPLTIREPQEADPIEKPEPEALADQGFALFVNLAGDDYQDADGNTWHKSKSFDGQLFGHENGTSTGKGDTAYPLQPWAETAIRGLTAFRAVVDDGIYEVTFCFCEQWTRDADRRRFYAVVERGSPQAISLPFYGPGIGRPWTHTIPQVIVKDGRLDIDFRPVDDQSLAILNAIVIRAVKPK